MDHIDFENGTCDFTSPEFLEFLEKTKLVGNSDPELTEREIGLGQPGLGRYWEEYRETQVVPYEITLYAERHNNVVTKSKEWFATTYMETHLTSFTLQSPLEYMTVPYPLLSTEGKLGIRTVDGFAMPSSLKNKGAGVGIYKILSKCQRRSQCLRIDRIPLALFGRLLFEYCNNRRIKTNLKGLPPAILRQQALSAA